MDDGDIVVKLNENNTSIHIDIPELKQEANISIDINNMTLSTLNLSIFIIFLTSKKYYTISIQLILLEIL